MWLPTPIYERVPQFWLLLGLLFMASGLYLGFDYVLSFLYFGVGFVCTVWSFCIFSIRGRSRKQPAETVDFPADAPIEDMQSESN